MSVNRLQQNTVTKESSEKSNPKAEASLVNSCNSCKDLSKEEWNHEEKDNYDSKPVKIFANFPLSWFTFLGFGLFLFDVWVVDLDYCASVFAKPSGFFFLRFIDPHSNCYGWEHQNRWLGISIAQVADIRLHSQWCHKWSWTPVKQSQVDSYQDSHGKHDWVVKGILSRQEMECNHYYRK